MATFSDNFDTDFTSRWTNLYNTPFWDGDNGFKTQSSVGSFSVYNTAAGDLTQYCRWKQRFDPYSGCVFRSTSVGSAGYYAVLITDTVTYWVKGDASTPITTIDSTAQTAAIDDVFAATCQGTGTGTIISVWKNPANNTPFDVNNWDSASDPADVTFTTDPGANAVDVGTYVGLGIDTSATMDDFYGGAFASGSALSVSLSEPVIGTSTF